MKQGKQWMVQGMHKALHSLLGLQHSLVATR